MTMVEFKDPATGQSFWINPDYVQMVQPDKVGSVIVLQNNVAFVKDTVATVVYKLKVGYDA